MDCMIFLITKKVKEPTVFCSWWQPQHSENHVYHHRWKQWLKNSKRIPEMKTESSSHKPAREMSDNQGTKKTKNQRRKIRKSWYQESKSCQKRSCWFLFLWKLIVFANKKWLDTGKKKRGKFLGFLFLENKKKGVRNGYAMKYQVLLGRL